MKLLEFTSKGIYCSIGDFYIDPWLPVDKAIITHAHADHARWGMKQYICHHHTKPILYKRIGEDISCSSFKYSEKIVINGVQVSFHPAGHIIGSSQIRLEYKGYVVVISGDYKVQDDGLSVPFEPIKCHEFVTESTFGLPIYKWNSIDSLNKKMQEWTLKNKDQGKTSIFVGYSLGKAQRIMKALEGIGAIHVHQSIARLNEAFTEVGVELPKYHKADFVQNKTKLQNEILIVPPALLESNFIKKMPNSAIAICSGWMQVRGSRRWRSADAGFAVSDHADWDGLLKAIKATEAEKIYVTHGKTEVFSKYLNELGYQAEVVKTHFENEEDLTQMPSTEV